MVIKTQEDKIRTIQKSGNSYSMYLPMGWIKRAKLDTSPTIRIKEDEFGNLVLSPSRMAKVAIIEKVIDVKNYDFDFVNRLIAGCYMNGHSKFKLNFGKAIGPKEILKHKKRLDKMGLDVEILEATNESVTFYTNESLVSPVIIFKNLINKTLNLVRAKEQNELELVNEYKKEVSKARYIVYRSFRTAVKNPSALTEFEISAMDCLNISVITQHLVNLTHVVTNQKLADDEIDNLKKLLEILLIFATEKNFDTLWKYNDILKKVKNERLEEELRKIHRELTKWWIGY